MMTNMAACQDRSRVYGLTAARLNGIAGDSSYSAASRSLRCAPLKSFGRIYCLTGTRSMIMRGKRTPAIGIHVIPKQTSRYVVWKSVNMAIVLNGTVSTNVVWYSSSTLQRLVNGKHLSLTRGLLMTRLQTILHILYNDMIYCFHQITHL